MSNTENNSSSGDQLFMPFVSDEMFMELTGGLAKSDIHPLIVAMKDNIATVQAGIEGENHPVGLRSGNLANGALFPELIIEDEEAITMLKSYGGKDFTATVLCFSDVDVNTISFDVQEGTRVQDVTDFDLIPKAHWRALNIAKSEIDILQAQSRAKRHGGFLRRHHEKHVA